ncbi:MAG: hypothetical protein AAF517_23355 [Planctomycetota bacterium]
MVAAKGSLHEATLVGTVRGMLEEHTDKRSSALASTDVSRIREVEDRLSQLRQLMPGLHVAPSEYLDKAIEKLPRAGAPKTKSAPAESRIAGLDGSPSTAPPGARRL